MKPHDNSLYLRHILDAIARIEQYVQGLNQEGFEQNSLVQDGVIRQMLVIGEAVKLLSEDLRSAYADIPWSDFAGMRDVLVHRYFGVNIEKIWLTVQDDLPVLKEQLTAILMELAAQQSENQDD